MFENGFYKIKYDVFKNPIFKSHLWILRFYGLIIVENKDNFNLLWYFIRTLLITAYIFVTSALIFVRVTKGYEKLADGAITWATGFLAGTTGLVILNAHLFRQRLAKLLSCAHKDITNILSNGDEIELELHHKTIRYLKIVSILLGIAMTGGAFLAFCDSLIRMVIVPEQVFNLPEILNGTAQPITLFLLLPFPEIVGHFWIGFFLTTNILFVGCLYISIWHTFVTCLFEFATLKQRIVNKRVREMDLTKISFKLKGNDDIKKLSESEHNYLRWKMLEFCIKEQLKTRKFLEDLQELIRWPIFIDFLVSSFLICFLLFYFTTSTLNKFQYLFTSFYIFAMVLKLLLYHWHSDKVKDVHEDLQVALYSCGWYDFPVNLQKVVFLMIMSSTKPLTITAIMVELNLKTFLDVVRGAYSFLNLLRESKNY